MNYLVLAAGMGTRLHPYTRNYPKSMLKLGNNKCALQNTIDSIKKYDKTAQITTVVGFNQDIIKNSISGCKFIENPFFKDTNSIASLWFAKELLDNDITIINADVVFEDSLWQKIITTDFEAFVCIDSSIKQDGDYNVQVIDDNVILMSKELKDYFGEYAGITKLNKKNAQILKQEIVEMVKDGFYNEWYENSLVQTILNNKMSVKYLDIQEYNWAELDTINDLFLARQMTKTQGEE